ncbi:hypothetical protein VTG60DRAFT_5757 [Thermothelomyces hinnuleus]
MTATNLAWSSSNGASRAGAQSRPRAIPDPAIAPSPPSTVAQVSAEGESTMPPDNDPNSRETLTVHTSLLFDPIQKSFLENVSVEVNTKTGAIARLYRRDSSHLPGPLSEHDIDLRDKVVLPGFVDSHTHIFLHSDKYFPPPPFSLTPYPGAGLAPPILLSTILTWN